MKTVSPVLEQEKLSIEETSNNPSFSEVSQEPVFHESDNLIVCSADLASSLQDVKLEKPRLNPGHYIHKVFLHKLKSQSASNLEKKKTDYLPNNVNNDDNKESVSPLMNVEETVPEEISIKENNDSWFKTWPECGVDKCVVRNGKLLDIANKSESPEDLQRSRTLFDEPSKKSEVCNVVSVAELLNCHCNISNKCICSLSARIQINPPVPLDNLLQSIPLAYSPITKQIHILKSNNNDSDTSIDINSTENDEESLNVDVKVPCEKTLCRVSTEVSSFSSNVSSLSDISPSTNEDSVSGSFIDPSDSCSLVSIGNCSLVSEDSGGAKSKRKGISSFFTRGVFGWKGRSESQYNGDGWSLFGKGSLTSANRSSSLSIDRHSEDGQSVDSGRGVLGSTGLIQLERPAWLPAKPKQERDAHADQHDKIINSARKRELKEAKQRKKLLQSQLKAENELSHAAKIWMQEILPKWKQSKTQRRTQDLWWQGVPPCVRGKLWTLAISNDLNITHELYEICVVRAQERLKSQRGSTDSVSEIQEADREASMELIQLDISRTFPNICIFQKGGPYYDMLHCLLAAYVCYRPDVGYVQGMSFIAAVLILNMDAPDAFICFANLLNGSCLRAFYSLDQPLMEGYYATYKELLKENLPKLYMHLDASRLSPDLYLLDWIYTIFSKSMSLDVVSRVWDVFLRDGDEFLFKTALGVLHLYQETLLGMDFLIGSQFLTRLPEDLTPNQLFKSISSIKMSASKRNFNQILSIYIHPSG